MAENPTHTPGPWTVGGATEWDAEYGGDADAYSTQPISAAGFEAVCIVVGLNDNDETFDANARLIAAAPELLAALQIARDYIVIHRNDFGEVMNDKAVTDLAAIDAALAKAGAQP